MTRDIVKTTVLFTILSCGIFVVYRWYYT